MEASSHAACGGPELSRVSRAGVCGTCKPSGPSRARAGAAETVLVVARRLIRCLAMLPSRPPAGSKQVPPRRPHNANHNA